MINIGSDGTFYMADPHNDHLLVFAQTWAEQLERQLRALREARGSVDSFPTGEGPDFNFGYDGQYTPGFRHLWAQSVITIWIADTLDRWITELHKVLGAGGWETPEYLRGLRNTLLHLDESRLDEHGASANKDLRRRQSIESLPGSRLDFDSIEADKLFDLIDLDQLQSMSKDLLERLEWILHTYAEDIAVDRAIDEMRGR